MKNIVLTILSVILLASCSVQKRRYQKGFYITRPHKQEIKPTETAERKKSVPAKPVSEVVTELRTGDQVLEASGDINTPLTFKRKSPPGDSCDVMLFKDGSEIQARVIEVNPTDIKYKRCDNPDGPVYITRKTELFMIKYANGSREVIKAAEPAPSQELPSYKKKDYRKPRVTHPLAPLALVLGIASIVAGYLVLIFASSGMMFPPFIILPLILLALIAVVVSKTVLDRIKEQPDHYKGKGLAMPGLIMGIVMLGIYAVIGLFILALGI